MQIVPGQLNVFGTTDGIVMFETLTGYAQALMTDLPPGNYNPGDVIPGYIWRDGSYHSDPEV